MDCIMTSIGINIKSIDFLSIFIQSRGGNIRPSTIVLAEASTIALVVICRYRYAVEEACLKCCLADVMVGEVA